LLHNRPWLANSHTAKSLSVMYSLVSEKELITPPIAKEGGEKSL
jgi:hypothetical protein